MRHFCLAAAIVVTLAAPLRALTTGMFDPTGMPLIERLLTGTSISANDIDPNSVEYVGLIDGAQAQAGLFSQLELRGSNNTSLSLGPGVVITSGLITSLPTTNTLGSYSNVTKTGGNNYFHDFPAQTGSSRHGGRLDENDENSIAFDLDVAADVQGLTLDFVYASEEFPEWSGTQFADGFVFLVDGVNYAKLPDGRPVSLLRQEDNIHFMTNGDSGDPLVPTVADVEYDGLTRVLQLTAPLAAGQRNRITIAVGDTGDEVYDSAAYLSSFRLLIGNEPLPAGEIGVKVRHTGQDDAFHEPGDFDGDGDVDGSDFLTWQVGLGTTFTAADLASWRNHFGQGVAPGASSVPEPTSALLMLCGMAGLGRPRHRASAARG